MRSPEELQQALAILGSTFTLDGGVRHYVWNEYPDEFRSAKGMFLALSWMDGADESGMEELVEYARLKLLQYQQQKEKANV